MQVYQDLRLTRNELSEINRALVESLGDIESVRSEFRVRAVDMDAIVRRLYLKDEDLTRLAKKLGINIDPFAEESAAALREIFEVDDLQRLPRNFARWRAAFDLECKRTRERGWHHCPCW